MPTLRTRLFQAYVRLIRPMTLGVRGIVENASGEILLVHHTYMSGWFLPGGGVERGEPCIKALRKELQEEGGIILCGTPALIGVFSNHASFRNDHVLLYHVPHTIWQPGKVTAHREIAQIMWCQPDDLPEDTTPATRARIRDFYSEADPTPYWGGTPEK